MKREFFSSESLRSFYKTAKSRGWVNEEKESKIVRTVSAQPAVLEPTTDLLLDLCRLADALRIKGYIKQADDLEARIINYKTAETHLYNVHDEDGPDLLEFAHPEGDFKVEDAKDGLGVIETLLSSHKKIIDVVKKEPTGKLASLANLILKSAQEAPSSIGEVERINSGIEELKVAIHADELGQSGQSIYTLDPVVILGWYNDPGTYKVNIEIFTKKYPQIAQSVANFAARERAIYGDSPRSAATIAQFIHSKTNTLNISGASRDLIQYGRNINASGKYDKYFQGTRPGASKSTSITFGDAAADNPESIWEIANFDLDGIDTNDTQINKVANEMYSDMIDQRKAVFTALPGVNGSIRSYINKSVDTLSAFIIQSTGIPEGYIERIKPLASYTVPTGKDYQELVSLMVLVGKSPIEYQTSAASLSATISGLIQSQTGKTGGQLQVTTTRFKKAAELFRVAADKNPSTRGYRENFVRSEQIARILTENADNMSRLIDELSKVIGQSFKTLTDVDRFSIEWLNAARQLTGSATSQRALSLDELPTERAV